MTSRVVLNIGWARAASTAFRHNFLERHPEIRAVDCRQIFFDGPGAFLLNQLKTASDAEFRQNAPALRAEWEAYVAGQDVPIVCLTDEELSIGRPDAEATPEAIAARCAVLFPKARTLAVVRDQPEAIASFYGLAARYGSTEGLSLSAWARRHFLESQGQGFAYMFDYARTLGAYLAWQAPEDVVVLPYDRSGGARTHAAAARALGVSAAACSDLPVEILNASEHPGTRPSYETGVEVEIRELYAASNRRLADRFGIVFAAPEMCA